MMVPPVILAPGRCRQERHELEASLGYIVKLSWGEKTKTHIFEISSSEIFENDTQLVVHYLLL